MSYSIVYGEAPYQMTVVRDTSDSILRVEMPCASDFHAHMRDGPMMQAVAPQQMGWANYLLVMPNTGPIVTVPQMVEYHKMLVTEAELLGLHLKIIPTLYFTDLLTPAVVEELANIPFRCAVKYYPPAKGATTGSGYGVPLGDMHETLQAMSDNGIRLLGHFESVHDSHSNEIPHKDREDYFLEHEYPALRDAYPDLQICIEHASTQRAIDIVKADTSGKTVCTITPHHLLFVAGDLHAHVRRWANHIKCMPIIKKPDDRSALVEIATSGDYRAILGSDTAPHPSRSKAGPYDEAMCGAYLPHALALYVKAFEDAGKLNEVFINFACLNGPRWWDLPLEGCKRRLVLTKDEKHDIPDPTHVSELFDYVIPLGWWENEEDRLRIGHRLVDD